jgi:hypothetical protein
MRDEEIFFVLIHFSINIVHRIQISNTGLYAIYIATANSYISLIIKIL